jgi:chemosensory pili system protein ChpA (sensor histidine kinase/response regulator)
LRRLNAEADEQVKANWEAGRAEGKYSGDFDPLEMDQYSRPAAAVQAAVRVRLRLARHQAIRWSNKSRDTETLLLQQGRVNTELQEGLMRSRMVPFDRAGAASAPDRASGGRRAEKAHRVPRRQRRKARWTAPCSSASSRRWNTCCATPVDHGVEPADKRVLPPASRRRSHIRLALSREGGEVVLTLADDGGGIRLDAVACARPSSAA